MKRMKRKNWRKIKIQKRDLLLHFKRMESIDQEKQWLKISHQSMMLHGLKNYKMKVLGIKWLLQAKTSIKLILMITLLLLQSISWADKRLYITMKKILDSISNKQMKNQGLVALWWVLQRMLKVIHQSKDSKNNKKQFRTFKNKKKWHTDFQEPQQKLMMKKMF